MYQIAQGYSQAIQECADKFAGNEQWQCSTKTVKNKSKGKKRNEMDITLNEGKCLNFFNVKLNGICSEQGIVIHEFDDFDWRSL